jgi:hypothetical protein
LLDGHLFELFIEVSVLGNKAYHLDLALELVAVAHFLSIVRVLIRPLVVFKLHREGVA